MEGNEKIIVGYNNVFYGTTSGHSFSLEDQLSNREARAIVERLGFSPSNIQKIMTLIPCFPNYIMTPRNESEI